jgi:hypothetical protein
VPELDTFVFNIPVERVRNGEERLVVLEGIAKSMVESVRGRPGRRLGNASRPPRKCALKSPA